MSYVYMYLDASQIGSNFNSKANESYCLYNSGPLVRHYALKYGFHTLPNVMIDSLKNPYALFKLF